MKDMAKFRYKFMAALLSFLMVLSAIIAPKTLATAHAAGANPVAAGSLDIRVPRNGADKNADAKAREINIYKVADTDDLQGASAKYDAMTAAQIGAEASLVDTVKSAVETDNDGASHDVFKIRGVAPGTYVFKETEDSANSHEYKMITIAWNAESGATSSVVNVKTHKPEQPLVLHKIAYNKNTKPMTTISLAGVHFNLLDSKGTAINLSRTADGVYQFQADGANLTADLVTNEDGNITVNGLPAGEYTFRETQTIEPYVIIEANRDHKFTFDPAKGHNMTVVNSENPSKGRDNTTIHLHKYDGTTNANLEGVEFRLYIKTGNELMPVGPKEGGGYQYGPEINHIFRTDASGNIILDDLPNLPEASSYVFREVKALDGYVVNDNYYTAENKRVVEVPNYKGPTPMEVRLTKTDLVTGNPLDRVGFELYRVKTQDATDGTNMATTTTERVVLKGANGRYEYEENIRQADQVYQLYTNEQGQVSVTGLPEGTYFFRENEVKAGYDLAENRGKESARLTRANNSATVTNRPTTPPNVTPPPVEPPTPNEPPKEDTPGEPKGGYRFIKVDDSEEQKRLAGALFALYSVGDNGRATPYEVDGKRYTVRSGDNGEFTITGLPYGKYVLRETVAPEGHILNVNPIEFTVDEKSMAAEAIMIVNERTPDRPTVPPVVSPPGTTTPPPSTPPTTPPTRNYVPPVVSPPGTSYVPPTTTRQTVPPVVSPPGTTYYVPKDTPGVPRGPLVKTGDIRIVILVALGLIMIFGGSFLVRKGEKDQAMVLA